jgi:cyclic beta-1,2-glucan synthetase
VGTVLDPVFSLRRRLAIRSGGVARLAFWTLVASLRLVRKELSEVVKARDE